MGPHSQFEFEELEPRVLLSGTDPAVVMDDASAAEAEAAKPAAALEPEGDVWQALSLPTEVPPDESFGGLTAQSLPEDPFDPSQYPKETQGPNPADDGPQAPAHSPPPSGSGIFDPPAPGQPAPTLFASTDAPKALADQATTTSTITVPGSFRVADVDVTLDIDHGRVSDLEVTLIGPSGLRVPLFAAVGGSGANFNGTTIDDEAPVPITLGTPSFSGRYFGSGYLGDFDGLAGNGIWTLEVIDHAAGTAGTLNGWSLTLTPAPAQSLPTQPYGISPGVNWLSLHDTLGTPGGEKVYAIDLVAGQRISVAVQTPERGASRFGNYAGLAIPENGAAALSTIDIPTSLTLADLDVLVAIDHPNVAELAVTLISPTGVRIGLSSGNGSDGDGYFYTIFDDEAALAMADAGSAAPFGGRFQPESELSGLDGGDAAGTWQLEIVDSSGGPAGAGQLIGWELHANAGLDAAIRVFGPDGELALNHGAAAGVADPAVAGVTIPTTGRYFIQVIGTGQSAGDFHLEVGVFDPTVIQDAGTVTDLAAARAAGGGNATILGISGGIGQTKLFTTTLTAGESIMVAAGTPGGFHLPRISVLGPSDFVLGDTGSGPGSDAYLRFTVPTTGVYAIAVDYPSNQEFRDAVSTGTFVLSLAVVDGAGNEVRTGARPISNFGYHEILEAAHASGAIGSQGEWDGQIAPAGDLDYFALGQLPAGEVIEIEAARRGASTLFAAIHLVDGTGQVLFSASPSRAGGDIGQAKLAIRIQASGQYYLLAEGAPTEAEGATPSTGEYRLRYTRFGIVNVPPTGISFANTAGSLPEDTSTAERLRVADIVVSDDGWGTNNLSILGAGAAHFAIVGSSLYLRAGVVLNFEALSTLSATIAVDDPAVGSNPDATGLFSLAIQDVNEPPSVALANTVTSLPQNTSTSVRIRVADIVVTDDALGTNNLFLSGPDAVLFRISGNQLMLRAGVILDHVANPSLDVTVSVEDPGVGANPDASAALSIAVTPPNFPPALALANVVNSLPEATSTAARVKIADVVITDEGQGTNALSLTGPDAALFELIGLELFLKAGVALDFETKPTLLATIAVDDAAVGSTPDDTEALAISITDSNEPPTGVALANVVAEILSNTSTAVRIRVADIVVSDDALGTNLLTLSGPDAALFRIVGTQVLLRAGVVLDPVGNPLLEVTVHVDDADVGSTPDASVALAMAVVRPNLPPSLSLANAVAELPESTPTSSPVKVADIVVSDDGLGSNALSLHGADAALFEITGGSLFLKAGTALDFETKPSLSVSVAVDDPAVGANPDDSENLTIAVTSSNEPPTAILLSNTVASLPQETSTAARIRVADIAVADDALGTNMLTIAGPDAVLFRIVGNQLLLRAGVVLDAAANPSLDVVIQVDDPSVGTTPDATQSFSIAIIPPNLPPSVSLANVTAALPENTSTASPVKVADVVVTDDGQGTNLLSLSGADAALFEIAGGGLFLKAGAALDFETNPTLDVAVTVDDPSVGASPDDSDILAMAVTDANDAPSAVNLTNIVTELPADTSTAQRIPVANIAITDDALGTNALTLTGPDAHLFRIVGMQVLLRAGVILDASANPVLEATVHVDDATAGGTPDASQALAIAITPPNQPPGVSLTNTVTSLPEDTSTAGAVKVADIVITDDGRGTNQLGLTGDDASLFEIVGAGLYLKAGVVLDFETNPALDVAVAVDDPSVGLTPDATASLAISVTDSNDPPAAVQLANVVASLPESTSTATRIRVADIVVTDDLLGANLLTLSGPDAHLFRIVGLQVLLRAGVILDASANPLLEATVLVDDLAVGSTPDATVNLAIQIT